jgi:hypothetical protein
LGARMLRLLIESWSQVPQWLRIAIGLQIAAVGWVLHVMAARMGNGSPGPAGFTIGLGLAVAACAIRNRPAERDGE